MKQAYLMLALAIAHEDERTISMSQVCYHKEISILMVR